jgi:peptidase A4-like protein
MKHGRWLGLAAAGVFSVAAAPVAAAAPALTSGGVALHIHGATSGNWSGYVDTAVTNPYTFLEANWTEPKYTCDGNSPESWAVWVGLDGWSDQTVEQGGTIAICSGKNQGTHYAWWEMYPHNSVQEIFPVKVGDKMYASVTYNAGSSKPYNIYVWDETSNMSLNVNEACSSTCSRSSAEWIVESPGIDGQIAYLPKFKPIVFTEGFSSVNPGATSGSSIKSFAHQAVTMTGASGNRAVPSALTSNGEGFSDKWVSSTP